MSAEPRVNNTLISIAGVHHVVSELSRRGLIALPTVKNTAAYDIVALNVEGTRHANIQVKASLKRVSFFPMPMPNKIRAGRHDYYVLARLLVREGRFECFLLSGSEAKRAVEAELKAQRARIAARKRRKEFSSIPVAPKNATAAARWQKAWETFDL